MAQNTDNASKNPRCPLEPGSTECFTVHWPLSVMICGNPCQFCSWWDEFCRCPVCHDVECKCDGDPEIASSDRPLG